jgi:hypothetical protein
MRREDLPVLRDAVGREEPARGRAAVGGLRLDLHRQPGAEDPRVPGVVDRRGRRRQTPGRSLLDDAQLAPLVRGQHIAHEAEGQHAREALAQLVGRVGLGGCVRQVLVDSPETAEADEAHRVFQATAAGPLRRDEHVHVGVLAHAHPVDERDLRTQEVEVAVGGDAVEEQADPLGVRANLPLLRAASHERTAAQAEGELVQMKETDAWVRISDAGGPGTAQPP